LVRVIRQAEPTLRRYVRFKQSRYSDTFLPLRSIFKTSSNLQCVHVIMRPFSLRNQAQLHCSCSLPGSANCISFPFLSRVDSSFMYRSHVKLAESHYSKSRTKSSGDPLISRIDARCFSTALRISSWHWFTPNPPTCCFDPKRANAATSTWTSCEPKLYRDTELLTMVSESSSTKPSWNASRCRR
jgi:hypothetical protein